MKKNWLGLSGVLVFLLVWGITAELLTRYRGAVPFPGPLSVFIKLIAFIRGESLYNHTIYEHMGSSLVLWAAGLFQGILFGLPWGIVLGRTDLLRRIFLPFFSILHVIPGMAWIPIALLLFGIGKEATVFMIFITSFPPVVFNTQAAVRDIPPIYGRVSSMMELNTVPLIFRVYLPAVIPGLITGLRLAFAAAWRVLIAAEMIVGANKGLGYSILQARWTLDFEAAFVFVLLIALIGLIFEKGIFEPLDRKIRLQRGLAG